MKRRRGRPMDLTGQIHGKLIVIDRERDPSKLISEKGPTWFCICECGKPVHVRTHQLTSGQCRSCGCWTRITQKKYDLKGQRFGMLTVICETEKKVCKDGKSTKIQWSCQCDCGNITVGTTGMLRSGCKKSCGCLRGKKRRERAEREAEEARLNKKAKKEPASILSDSWEIGSY